MCRPLGSSAATNPGEVHPEVCALVGLGENECLGRLVERGPEYYQPWESGESTTIGRHV